MSVSVEKWVVYAFISMVFAGFTSVIAKFGLTGISAELGIAVRTSFVFIVVLGVAALSVPAADWTTLNADNLKWLALSALTTTGSWVFYYKAIKVGEVATVALIDKGSMFIVVMLSWVLVKEQMTPRMVFGGALSLNGLVVSARKEAKELDAKDGTRPQR